MKRLFVLIIVLTLAGCVTPPEKKPEFCEEMVIRVEQDHTGDVVAWIDEDLDGECDYAYYFDMRSNGELEITDQFSCEGADALWEMYINQEPVDSLHTKKIAI